MDIKSFDLRSRLAADAGENSIMQTITIAVSAILIAAGLVTAPGLINNARDNNARTDLANVAFSQEFVLANTGSYAEDLAALLAAEPSAADIEAGQSGPRLTLSGGVVIEIENTTADGYTAIAISESGKVFHRLAATGEVFFTGTITDADAAENPNTFTPAAGVTGAALGFPGADAATQNAALATAVEALGATR